MLLYYPDIEALKDTVICGQQVVYNSTSNLIRNTFTFEKVGKQANEKFREKAQFSLKDVKKATSEHTDDLIPLGKLVKLLENRNILAVKPASEGDSTREPIYFMPCVLRNAPPRELSICASSSDSDPAPLMLRYNCGYVPVGVFPAMITNLISQQVQGWKLIEEGLCKNRVQFHVGKDYDTLTLISRPRFLEFVISRSDKFRTPTHSLCVHIRSVIQSTLAAVTSCMNYHFSMAYKFGFECPTHPGREHLCVLAEETAEKMECLQNRKRVQPVNMEPCHRVWFVELEGVSPAVPTSISSASGLPGRTVNTTPYSAISCVVSVAFQPPLSLSLTITSTLTPPHSPKNHSPSVSARSLYNAIENSLCALYRHCTLLHSVSLSQAP